MTSAQTTLIHKAFSATISTKTLQRNFSPDNAGHMAVIPMRTAASPEAANYNRCLPARFK
jgi:hypothetical protein